MSRAKRKNLRWQTSPTILRTPKPVRIFGDQLEVTEGDLPGYEKVIRVAFIDSKTGQALEGFVGMDGALKLQMLLSKAINAATGLET